MQNHWYSISLADVFSELKSKKDGLTGSETDKRLKGLGRNVLPQEKPYSKIRLFLSQFNSPLMYILLAVVVISLLLKHYSDTILLLLCCPLTPLSASFKRIRPINLCVP